MKHSSIHFQKRSAGFSTGLTLVSLIVLLAVGLGGWAIFGGGDDTDSFNPIIAEVTAGEFVAKVLDQGEVESSSNVEIRCEVKARNGDVAVLQIADEGSQVVTGDFLLQLDSTSFEKELDEQNIMIAASKTNVIKAETTLETAKATRLEYTEGVFVEALQTVENEIFDAKSQISTAKQELEQSIAVLEHSEKLHSRGFITQRQLKADEFAVEKSKIAIEKATNLLSLSEQKKKVLVEVTREKELTQLDAEIRAAKVDLESQQQAFEIEKQKLADIKLAISKCRIVAPPGTNGQVVYSKEYRGRGEYWVLEEGASVRENQVLLRIPDPTRMQVKASINEQSITQIAPNMPVMVEVDALSELPMQGIVVKVNQYAESKSRYGSSVRKYAVIIRILDPPQSLKPGMNASVSIQTQFEQEGLMAPLQTVYSLQDRSFCLVKTSEGQFETHEVEIAGDNSKMILFKEGVSAGDQLVMNPGYYTDRMDLPEVLTDQSIDLPDNVELVKAEGDIGDSEQEEKPSQGERSGGMVDGILSRFDKNADGTIDADEMKGLEGRSKDLIGRADTDSDGKVTKAELRRVAATMPKGRPGDRGGERGGRPGAGPAGGNRPSGKLAPGSQL